MNAHLKVTLVEIEFDPIINSHYWLNIMLFKSSQCMVNLGTLGRLGGFPSLSHNQPW